MWLLGFTWVISLSITRASTKSNYSVVSSKTEDWKHGFQVNCDKNTNISAMCTDTKKQIIRTRLLRTNLKSRGILPFCQACTSFLPALSLLHSLLYLFITTNNYYNIVIRIMPQQCDFNSREKSNWKCSVSTEFFRKNVWLLSEE